MTPEDLEVYLGGDKVECLLCGKAFKALGQHISRAHDITCDEYREQFGIPYLRGLVAEPLRQRFSDIQTAKASDPEFRKTLRDNLQRGRVLLSRRTATGWVGRLVARQRKEGMGLLCLACGVELVRRDGEALFDMKRRDTCSPSCERHLRQSRRPEEPPKQCVECGDNFARKEGEVLCNYRQRMTCSPGCANRRRVRAMTGGKVDTWIPKAQR